MKAQMMRVISSPSSSTIGFATLILAIGCVPSRLVADLSRTCTASVAATHGADPLRHGPAPLVGGRTDGPTLGGDGLRLVARAVGPASRGPGGGGQGRRHLPAVRRALARRLLPGVLPRARQAGLDRHDLADGV